MRIGILTLPLHTNYGGILQAYALQTVLERMGHEVKVINKTAVYRLPVWKAPFVYAKRILKNICGENIPVFLEQKLLKEKPIIRQNTDKFIKRPPRNEAITLIINIFSPYCITYHKYDLFPKGIRSISFKSHLYISLITTSQKK